MAVLLLFLLFLTTADCYSRFDTNCILPHSSVNYVSSANTRGTMEIVWSSLFTILACTWTALHLNVPEQRNGRDAGLRGNIKWKLKAVLAHARWMLVTILAPEVLIVKYSDDLQATRIDHKKLKDFAEEDQVPWTLSHSIFTSMGGLVIRSFVPERIGVQAQRIDRGFADPHAQAILPGGSCTRCNDKHGLEAELLAEIGSGPTNGVECETQKAVSVKATVKGPGSDESGSETTVNHKVKDTQDLPGQTKTIYHLTPVDLLRLRDSGHLTRLPYIPVDELKDRGKTDAFLRCIAVVQILGSLVQIISRAVRGLDITQLELAVIAYAACGVAIYGLSWHKPQGVQTPITIMQYSGKLPADIYAILDRQRYDSFATAHVSFLSQAAGMMFSLPYRQPGGHVPNLPVMPPSKVNMDHVAVKADLFEKFFWTHEEGPHYTMRFHRGHRYEVLAFQIVCLAFGGIHIGAWNFDFPTSIEQVLWRVSALFCTSFALMWHICSSVLLCAKLHHVWLWAVLINFLVYVYFVARAYLLVEVVRTLFYQMLLLIHGQRTFLQSTDLSQTLLENCRQHRQYLKSFCFMGI